MSQLIDLKQARALTLGSGCKLAFIKHTDITTTTDDAGHEHQHKIENIKPVLILTGINQQGIDGERVSSYAANGCVGIITTQFNDENKLDTHFKSPPISLNSNIEGSTSNVWLTLNAEQDKIVFPRIFIKSLQIKVDSDSLSVKYEDYGNIEQDKPLDYTVLEPYKDYSILTRSLQKKYAITLDSEMVIKKGIIGSYTGKVQPRNVLISYSISNADTSIYLDAMQILKENSVPKVSYDVKPNIFSSKYCETLYDNLGSIIRINDTDLKFKNVLGYISGMTLDLDNPDQDNIEVKNYKTKFEDLFSTITAQTEEMKKNSNLMQAVASAFTSTGDLSEQVLQSSIMKVDLNYAFNNGKLTIDQHNGIWGTSDNGVVAFRGGGIFTSTEKASNGDWKWNTGITPEGINANLITTGQLDTNLIKIYSGNNLRFQMNGDGIFSYKSRLTDSSPDNIHPEIRQQLEELQEKEKKHNITQSEQATLDELRNRMLSAQNSLDGQQYVLFNQEGLSLIAKKGARVLNTEKTDYITVLNDVDINKLKDGTDGVKKDIDKWRKLKKLQQIKRVEVSWDGFILRNWQNQRVFYAEPDTGNLVISGTINATKGHIGTWIFDNDAIWSPAGLDKNSNTYTQFVALNAGGSDNVSFTDKDGKPLYQYSNGEIKYDTNGNPIVKIVSTKDYAFWAGNVDPENAAFSIRKNGLIKATSGQIGGWSIQSDRLTSDAITLASTTTAFSRSASNDSFDESGKEQSNIVEQSVAVFWVHKADDTTKSASNSVLYIQSTGALHADQLYLLNYKRYNTTRVPQHISVSSLINKARNEAASAKSAADTAASIAKNAYVYLHLDDDGTLWGRRYDQLSSHSLGTHKK